MSKTIMLTVIAAISMSAGQARADVRADVEDKLHQEMRMYNDASVSELTTYNDCRKQLALAKKKLKPTTKLSSNNFSTVPHAVQDGDNWTITVADIPWICDAFDLLIARGSLFEALASAKNFQTTLAGNPPLDDNPNTRIGAGDYYFAQAKQCTATLDKEAATGATEVTWKGETISIADARELCGVIQKWGEYEDASGEANFEKVAPKYRELGVDGDRLRLFVEYDDVTWLGKKCVGIDDLKKLAKAKVVYQWLENSDGTYTIRKYAFKKNKYKVSEKTYLTEAKAYKGCK